MHRRSSRSSLPDPDLPPPESRPHQPVWKRHRLISIAFAVSIAIAITFAIVSQVSSSPSSSIPTASDSQANSTAPSNDPAVKDGTLCDTVKQDTGYITLPNTINAHYFYWYFESRSKPSEDPLVLWLTGGPGCSSLWAMLAENGPCFVQPDLSTKLNPYSWTTTANVIWLDQALSAGFSYGNSSLRATDPNINDLYAFLQGFFERHPGLRARDLYITGDGYAGHAIPQLSHYIWRKNQDVATPSSKRINLKGLAIGNGLTAPSIQYQHYLDISKNSYNILLEADFFDSALDYVNMCVDGVISCQLKASDSCNGKTWSYCDNFDYDVCEQVSRVCESMLAGLDRNQRNPYDIRKQCNASDPNECYDSTLIAKFLNSDKVRQYLGIPKDGPTAWAFCNKTLAENMTATSDYYSDDQAFIAAMLDGSDIRVLVYAGDADMVYNWYGVYAWTRALDWRHSAEFNDGAVRVFLTKRAQRAGMVRSYGSQFSFVLMYKAGRMVPMDQPAASLEMMQRFMRNEQI